MSKIQSKDHNVGSYRVNKVSLSCGNDKLQILEYGYYRLLHFH